MTNKIRIVLMNEWLIAAAVGVICFLVYLTTMCRTVSFIDAGELATVASVLGIAHPTGYPLFTLMAHCALWMPFASEEVLKLNAFSSLVVALAVAVFFRILLELARLVDQWKQKGSQLDSNGRPAVLISAAIASLVLGLSTTVWAQSVAVEVYGLHLLLILLTVFEFLKGIRENDGERQTISPRLVLAAFLLGLSFANHLTTLLIIPALIYLYIKSFGANRSSVRLAVKFLPFFILGLSAYLYLPLRAAAHPPLDWGYPAEGERFLWHVSGKQYRSWMFSGFESAEKQLTYFFNHFPSEFNWLVILVAVYGVWRIYRSSSSVFWFLLVAITSCLFYSVNYDIHDIDSYFLLAYLVAGVFVFFGINAILQRVAKSRLTLAFSASILLLISLPAWQLLHNQKEVDEADNFLVTDYVHNVFANSEPNALILSYQWDYFVAPSFYFQIVRHERRDLAIVDKELLRRSWYFIQLKDRYPWLIQQSQAEVDAFLVELYKFEHELPYDPRMIEARYVEMINSFIGQSIKSRPVYVGPEIEPEFGSRYLRLPAGLMFRLADDDSVAIPEPVIQYRKAAIETRLTEGMRSLYVKMLTATGGRFLEKKRLPDASFCVEKALSIDPGFRPARSIKERLDHSFSPGFW